ncbi:hypothetical protein Tco_0328909 [Tanacetum coccineum]
MLELLCATVSLKDAKFEVSKKFYRCYELELRVFKFKLSKSFAFLSTEVKGSTLKQSSAETRQISTGYNSRLSREGHFARECRFAKYQENRANGRNDKGLWYEDSKTQSLGLATDNNRHIALRTDGLDDLTGATKLLDCTRIASIDGYKLRVTDLKRRKNKKELDQAIKERDDFKVKLEKWSNASVLQNEVLNKQRYLSDKSCIGFGVESSSSKDSDNSSGSTNSAKCSLGIDELAIRNKVLNQENTKSSQPEIDRNKVIIEDWVDSDDEETDVSEIQKNTVFSTENSKISFESKSPNSQHSIGQESRQRDWET